MDREEPLSTSGILELYHTEAVPAIAAAVVLDNKFPEEVLNEIRNAFTHLAAANASPGNAAEELKNAKRHIRRVCVDCYKVCLFILSDRSERAVAVLEEELRLPNNVYSKMSELRTQRMKLSAAEGARSLKDPIGEYKQLVNDYDRFQQNLNDQFQGDSAELRRISRRARERKQFIKGQCVGAIIGFVIGTFASLAATYIWIRFFTTQS